jgi:hypothetical protein
MKKRPLGPIPAWPSSEAAKTQADARPLVAVTDETLPYTPRTLALPLRAARQRLGRVPLRFELVGTPQPLTLSARTTLGTLVGTSVAMRGAFGLIDRAASSQSTSPGYLKAHGAARLGDGPRLAEK